MKKPTKSSGERIAKDIKRVTRNQIDLELI